ncbi:MAG: PAS domain S-box protein [Porticoccaceae bacterium]|nr:PAS domain S-box protein [Porticoccaceae bacterium]
MGRRSRQQSVTLMALLSAVIPVILMTIGYGAVLYSRQLDEALSQQQQSSEGLKLRIEADLGRFSRRLLDSQARATEILAQPGQDSGQQSQWFLLSLLDSEPSFVQVLLISGQGDVVAGVKRQQSGTAALSTSEVRALLNLAGGAGGPAPEASQTSVPSSPVSIVAASKPGASFSFAMFTPGGSALKAQLLIALDASSAWLDEHYLSGSVGGFSGQYYLLDTEARVVAPLSGSTYRVGDVASHLRADDVALGDSHWPLQKSYHNVAGEAVYACRTAIPALAWTLVSELPTARVLQQVWPSLLTLLLFFSTLIILIAVFILRLMKRFLRPFTAARAAIEQISEGDYELVLQPVGIPEIDGMTASILHMATVRQAVEQALQESQQDLLVTLNSIGDGVITCDERGLVTRMSKVAEELTAWSMAEAEGEPVGVVFNIINASTGEPIANPIEKVLSSGKAVSLSNHTTLKARDGREYHIADSAAPIRDENHKTLGMVLVFNDVSEAYLLRQETALAQEELQALLADMHTMVCITEPDGTAIFANKSSLVGAGVTLADVKGKKFWDCVWFEGDPALQQQMRRNCTDVQAGASIQDDIQANMQGGLLWVEYSMHPMFNEQGEVVKILHEGRDISARKTMEVEALASAQHLKLYREQTPLAAIEWDNELHVVDWNAAAEHMFGYALDEIKGRDINGLLISEDEAVEAHKILKSLSLRGGARTGRTHTRTKDGRDIICEWHNTLLKNKEGEAMGAASVVLDITAQHKTQQALSLKEREQSDILNCMVDAVITIDECGLVLSVNKMAETLFGYRADELLGNNVALLMSPVDAAEHDSYIQRYIRTGEAHVIGQGREVDGRHKNKQIFPLRLQVAELPRDSAGLRRFIGTCHDLTKVKQQEEQLRRSYKMDALGKLTGGVAHDFNNILGVVTGYADLLESMLDEDSKLANYAHEINHAGQRGAKLTQKLLSFSRQGVAAATVVDIAALLQGQRDMLQKTLTVSIQLVLEYDAGLWPIWLDGSDLEDAVLNMSINAMHAMEGKTAGARLTISATNLSLSTLDVVTLGLPEAGDYVELRLADTGTGMDETIREQIFDPFFSTKGERGTGLGLSQVFGFVSRAGGGVKVYSELGLGSEFVLYFPRYIVASEEVESESSTDSEVPGGCERVLVVDDEEALRDLVTELLSQKGYRVTSAADARQALEIMQSASFDLLLSDLIMPGMNGYQLAAEVAEKYPLTKILLASGFADERNMEAIDEDLRERMLHKPYNSRVLYKAIRDLLDTSVERLR